MSWPPAPFSEWESFPLCLEKLPWVPLLCLVDAVYFIYLKRTSGGGGSVLTPLTSFSLGMARVVYKSKNKTSLEYEENYAGCRTVAVEAKLLVKPRGVHLQGGLHPQLTEGKLPCEPGDVLPPCPLNGALEVCSINWSFQKAQASGSAALCCLQQRGSPARAGTGDPFRFCCSFPANPQGL